MKVKLKANWCSDTDIKNRIIRQFGDKDSITLVTDDSYDMIIFFNYVTEEVIPGRLSFMFPQEPYWSGNHQKVIPDYITKAFVHDKKYFSNYKNVEESMAYTSYGGRGEWIDSQNDWNLETILSYKNNKSKIMSSCISTLGFNEISVPDNCLYKYRTELVTELINHDAIDFYAGWREWFKSPNVKSSPYKIDTVKDYKFTIAIENEYSKNWITEKFYDAILYETVPIYVGCSNITDIYPEVGYVLINDDPVEQINYICANSDKLYEKYLPGVRAIKQRYLQENNILVKIEKLGKEYGLI